MLLDQHMHEATPHHPPLRSRRHTAKSNERKLSQNGYLRRDAKETAWGSPLPGKYLQSRKLRSGIRTSGFKIRSSHARGRPTPRYTIAWRIPMPSLRPGSFRQRRPLRLLRLRTPTSTFHPVRPGFIRHRMLTQQDPLMFFLFSTTRIRHMLVKP